MSCCRYCEDGWLCTSGCISNGLKANPNADRYAAKRRKAGTQVHFKEENKAISPVRVHKND